MLSHSCKKKMQVDIVGICTQHFGLALHFLDLKSAYGEDTLGMIIPEHKLILCDQSIEPAGEYKERKERIMRFTLAHELGHYLFHQTYMNNETSPLFYQQLNGKERDRIEIQANLFASMLLMPEPFFKNMLRSLQNKGLKEQAIRKRLSSIFNVSAEAVSYRIASLEEGSKS
jgi:hypothetical protein